MTALIITQRRDTTADFVILALNDLGVPVVRIDYADFPDRASFTAVLQNGAWSGHLHVGERTVAFSEVSGIYYRRPTNPQPSGYGSQSRNAFIEKEIVHGFGGLLASLPENLWLGHPRRIFAVQRSKPWQLSLAAAEGFSVPETMVTGNTADAAAFAQRLGDEAAVKSFGRATFDGPNGEHQAIHTRRLTADEIRNADLAGIPHQIQQWIEASHAVRVTAVDQQLFAAEIHFGSPATRLDWRADPDSLTYKRVDPPASVASRVHSLMQTVRLRYAAFDFMVDAAGTWWFLEINANGQWAWIPEVANDIAEAIAHALTKTPAPAKA